MRIVILPLIVVASLSGCAFLPSKPDYPSQYSGQMLTQRDPRSLATCIAQAADGGVPYTIEGDSLVVNSNDVVLPNRYVVDVVDNHNVRQTRVLIGGGGGHQAEIERVARCLPDPATAGAGVVAP